MRSRYLVAMIAVFLISTCMNLCIAQDDENPDDPGPMPDMPVDGGISLLLAAGTVYGVRRLGLIKGKGDGRL